VVIRIDSASAVGTAGEPPAAIAAYRPTEQPAQAAGGGGDSLFDALVSPSWSGGGGFDRMAWPESPQGEQPQGQQPPEPQQAATTHQPMASTPMAAMPTAATPMPRREIPTSMQGARRPPPTAASLPPGTAGGISPAGNVSTGGSLAAVAGAGYRLGPGDQIDVFVWRNPDLSKQVPIRPDGRITLPLVGEVVATGKTVQQLQDELTSRLGEYVQMPTVTVSVSAVRSLVVYVLGNVRTPGPVQMDRNLTVLQAVAMAGGVNEFADRNDIVVMRTDANGVHQRWSFRYDDVVDGKGLSTNVVLQSGDVIYVP
jgi:polysaccharide export outer membrane protein